MDDNGDKRLSREELRYVHFSNELMYCCLNYSSRDSDQSQYALLCNLSTKYSYYMLKISCILFTFLFLRSGLADYGIELNLREMDEVFNYFGTYSSF